MLKIQDLIIDPRSLGNKLWLVDIAPVYEYRDNARTNNIIGHRYVVALPDKELEKIGVKIDGPQLLDKPDGYVPVTFDGLELSIYWSQGQPQVGARATGIHLVTNTKG